MLILHTLKTWALLPEMILTHGIYSDPKKPSHVKLGLYTIGKPDKSSPVLITTNYALTFYTVKDDLEVSGVNYYLLVLETKMAVSTSIAGKKFTGQKIAQLIKRTDVERLVESKKLIMLAIAKVLKEEIERATG